MSTIITFGETLLRLSAPSRERLLQSRRFEVDIGGAEVNVAAALSNFGESVQLVSVVPSSDIGDAVVRELRSLSIGDRWLVRSIHRQGLYYLECGADQRPSNVIYDRANTGLALLPPQTWPWEEIFQEAGWFHITGITPALSQTAADSCLAAVRSASAAGITISCDLNFRNKLWQYGRAAHEVMPEIFEYVNVAIANESDSKACLGLALNDKEPEAVDDRFIALTQMMKATYPRLEVIAATARRSLSADHNIFSGLLEASGRIYASRAYELHHIVDRVGAGDAFSAGLIYSLRSRESFQEAIDLAAAAGCLKHTIPGDTLRASLSEVRQITKGDLTGRISR